MEEQMLKKIFEILYDTYGPQYWWPSDSDFETAVGAILTQSVSWRNVEMAINNLRRMDLLNPKKMYACLTGILEKCIKPAGFFKVKARRLKNFLEFLKDYDFDFDELKKFDTPTLRKVLLNVSGIGKETADTMLLYIFKRPVFVIDAYTIRLFERLTNEGKKTYDELQEFFQNNLENDPDLFGEFHALIVVHCKTVCKKKPVCSVCKINQNNLCKKAKMV
ncbi:MAG TPA: endonuclease [Thermotogaceae bacterium]|nr:endonuclease [Thermotogaceae bacterium]